MLGVAIGDQADIGAVRRVVAEMFHQGRHDRFAEALALVCRLERDIDDLEGRAAVADDPAHADCAPIVQGRNAELRVGQADPGLLGRFRA